MSVSREIAHKGALPRPQPGTVVWALRTPCCTMRCAMQLCTRAAVCLRPHRGRPFLRHPPRVQRRDDLSVACRLGRSQGKPGAACWSQEFFFWRRIQRIQQDFRGFFRISHDFTEFYIIFILETIFPHKCLHRLSPCCQQRQVKFLK